MTNHRIFAAIDDTRTIGNPEIPGIIVGSYMIHSFQVMELVKMKKPLTSLDFCYSGECENISVQETFPAKFIIQLNFPAKISNPFPPLSACTAYFFLPYCLKVGQG